MATITAGVIAGNWNVGATWVGGVAPTAADDAVIPATAVVTLPTATTCVCRSVTVAALGTLVWASTTAILNVGDASGGAATFSSTCTVTLTGIGTLGFVSTSDNGGTGWGVTSGGKTLPAMTFNGVGGKWVLQDALTSSGAVTLTAGTLDTNGQTVVAGSFSSNNSNTRTLTLGSSAVTLTAGAAVWNTTVVTGLTITANTATITMSGANANFTSATKDFNGLSLVFSGSGVAVLNGGTPNTFANVTRTGTAVKTDSMSTNGAFTCSGTFTVNANSDINRVLVQSNLAGTARTITAATVVITNTVDFQDITGAGAATWTVAGTGATYLGDCGGNSGITFTPSATQTHTTSAGGSWSDATKWTSRVPLPQDDVVVDANTTGTLTADMPRLGKTLTFTGFAGTLAYSTSISHAVYGSLTYGSGMSTTGSASFSVVFSGRTSTTFTPNGVSQNEQIAVSAPGGTLTLGSAFIGTGGTASQVNITVGTLDTNSQSVTAAALTFGTSNSNTKALIAGSSVFSFTTTGAGAAFFNASSATGTTISAESSTIVLSAASANSRTFSGGGFTYGTLRYDVADSPGTLLISGNNTFANLDVGPGRTVQFNASAVTHVDAWDVNGESRDYVYLPGASANNNIATPDTAANSITGDITVDVEVALTDWTPATEMALVTKWATTGNQRSWAFQVTTSGIVRFYISPGGDTVANVTISSTVAPTVANGDALWIRFTRTAATGNNRIYTSPDGETWTLLGTAVTSGAGVSAFDGTAPLELGTNTTSASPLGGKVYAARLYDSDLGSGSGTPVQSFDADAQVTGSDTWTNPTTSEVWTLNGLAAQGDGRVTINSSSATNAIVSQRMTETTGKKVSFFGDAHTRDGYLNLDGTGDYAMTPDHADLDITGDIDLIAKVRLTDWTPAIIAAVIAKRANTSGSNMSYQFAVNTTGTLDLMLSADGAIATSVASSVVTGVANDTDKWVRATWRDSDNRVQFFLSDDGVAWTQLGTDVTLAVAGIASTSAILEVGSRQSGTAANLVGRVYRAIVKDGIDGTTVFDADFTETPTVIESDYLALSDSTAIGHASWYAGRTSVDVSDNSGWLFVDYVTAVLAAPLGSLTASATATRTVPAVLAAPLGELAASASATVTVPAIFAAPLGSLTASASATLTVYAVLAAPLGSLVATASATVTVYAVLAAPLGVLTAAAAGTVIPAVHAVLAAVLGPLVAAIAAAVISPEGSMTVRVTSPTLATTVTGASLRTRVTSASMVTTVRGGG